MTSDSPAKYAIPCAFGFNDVMEEDSIFFLTFNTSNEKQAYQLARCVCGDTAEKALIILSHAGEVFHL